MAREELTAQLKERVERFTKSLQEGKGAIRQQMSDLTEQHRKFEALRGKWLKEIIEPCLAVLLNTLGKDNSVIERSSTGSLMLTVTPGDRFVVPARWIVSVSLDTTTAKARIRATTEILPILMDYDREDVIDLPLEESGSTDLERFLDSRAVRFCVDFLRANQPDSPYQKYRSAIDPVCGMTLPPVSATASLKHGTRMYYFCATSCRDQFASDPDKYL